MPFSASVFGAKPTVTAVSPPLAVRTVSIASAYACGARASGRRSLPESFFREITERTVAMAKKYGKQSERWLMGYNKRPDDFAQIDKVVDMYEELGVDRLATWTYRGGYGTVVAAKDALELWDNIGRNYKRVLKKED